MNIPTIQSKFIIAFICTEKQNRFQQRDAEIIVQETKQFVYQMLNDIR